jgi:hypothetical protein
VASTFFANATSYGPATSLNYPDAPVRRGVHGHRVHGHRWSPRPGAAGVHRRAPAGPHRRLPAHPWPSAPRAGSSVDPSRSRTQSSLR